MTGLEINANSICYFVYTGYTALVKCEYCMGSGETQDAKEVGADMKRHRLSRGVTLRDFAKALGISHTYLCQLENGTRRWRLAMVELYASKLETKKGKR